jgi:2-oxoisovalerate dehydrogenase E2 component (dihydrolipoyl transacylase)
MSDFMLPDIGEGIVECEVVEWHVAEGDVIEEDQPVVEVMTDKALVEITAPEAGRVTRLYVQKGEIAKVHAPLFAYRGRGRARGGGACRAGQGEGRPGRTAGSPGRDARGVAGRRCPEPGRQGVYPPRYRRGHRRVRGGGVARGRGRDHRRGPAGGRRDDRQGPGRDHRPEAGVIQRLHVAQGEIARVHAPLYAYLPEGSEAPDAAPEAGEASPAEPPRPRKAAAEEGAELDSPIEAGRGPYGRIPAAPAVRRLLREHGLALEEVPGSGRQGRVLKEDVLRYLEQDGTTRRERQAPVAADAEATRLAGPAGRAPASDEVRVEPLRGVRAVMARRMVEAASTIPHFQYGEEIDVTELLVLRERLKPRAAALGSKLTLMPFFMKALALAVREEPILNARLADDASEIHYLASVNVGMAVDSRAGLLVPNVKGVERCTLLEVAAEIQRLTEQAREGKVAAADLKGGTISISNIGALGGTYAAPIINAPEVAIVAIGKTQWLPRFDADDRVVKRAIMTVTWAGDHRIIDGGTIARFCNAWKGYLEAPETMLLHLG